MSGEVFSKGWRTPRRATGRDYLKCSSEVIVSDLETQVGCQYKVSPKVPRPQVTCKGVDSFQGSGVSTTTNTQLESP